MVTVYSQPGCSSCEATKAYLVTNHVKFTDKNIREDAEGRREFDALGYQGTPVVVAGDEHWAGHNPVKLASLINSCAVLSTEQYFGD